MRPGHRRQNPCCLVAWKSKILMTLRDMTSLAETKHKFIDLWRLEVCIWLRPRAVHVMQFIFCRVTVKTIYIASNCYRGVCKDRFEYTVNFGETKETGDLVDI